MNSLISRLVLRISYIRDMKEHLGKLEQTVGELQEDVIALAGEVVETRQQLAGTGQQLAGTGQQLAETQQQLIETRERLAETRLQLADTQQQFAEKEVQIRELQEQTSVWSRFFVHSLPAKSPCDFVFAAGAEAVDSTLVSRILGVAGAQSNKKEGGYVWDVISQEHWQHLDGLTREGMSLLAESPLTDGLLQGRALTQVLRESDQRNHWRNAALDADFVTTKEPMARHVSRCGGYERLPRNRARLRPGYVEAWYESLDGRGEGRVSHRPGADR